MGIETKIEWCDHTFNAWWGCVKISPACTNCYAASFAHRYGHEVWGKNASRRFFGEEHWNEPLKWNRDACARSVRKRVFCGSMMDILEDRPDLVAPRKKVFALIEQTPYLDWLLLTKRPENFVKMLPKDWLQQPRPNVWLGTTIESEDYMYRVNDLLECPAVVHFLSCEPLLGKIDLPKAYLREIDWIIVGGESGHRARQINPVWVKEIYNQCKTAGVAFFFKQWGMWNEYGIKFKNKHSAGRLLFGREWDEVPMTGQSNLTSRTTKNKDLRRK